MNDTKDYFKAIEQMPPDSAGKQIKELLQQGELNRFIQGICTSDATTLPSNHFFPVAHVNAGRLFNFGFEPNTSGIVLLSADTVSTHDDFQDYKLEIWVGLQNLVDSGDWKVSKPHHRMIWGYLDEKPWLLVLKETKKGELFAVSYHRNKNEW